MKEKKVEFPKKLLCAKTEKELTDIFLLQYSTDDFLYKLNILKFILDNYESLKGEFHKTMKKIDDGAVKRSLKSEIVFTFYHTTEALFALMHSFQNNPNNPWVKLSTYNDGELKYFAKNLKKDIDDKLIMEIIYGLDTDKRMDKKHIVSMKKSIRFVREYLKKLIPFFLDNEPYLAYKHGMRISHGGYEIRQGGKTLANGDQMLYLNKKKSFNRKEIKERGYYLFTKEMKYNKYLDLAKKNHSIIYNIIQSRKQPLLIEKGASKATSIELIELKGNVKKLFDGI